MCKDKSKCDILNCKIELVLDIFAILGLFSVIFELLIFFSIASLVLGIFLLISGKNRRIKWRSKVSIYISLFLSILGISLFVFAILYPGGGARRKACINNTYRTVRLIHSACIDYAVKNNGMLPPNINRLVQEDYLSQTKLKNYYFNDENGFRLVAKGKLLDCDNRDILAVSSKYDKGFPLIFVTIRGDIVAAESTQVVPMKRVFRPNEVDRMWGPNEMDQRSSVDMDTDAQK